MSEIILLGLNHTTAPVELRECLAFTTDDTERAVVQLADNPAVEEVVLFSTCNRIEVLLVAKDPGKAVELSKSFLSEFKQVPVNDFNIATYVHCGDEAVGHVFRVAASLDSMMLGEPQILGQIKEAYRTASEKRTSGVILNRLMHRAFFTAKRIRNETGIGDNAVSISYAAVQLGRKIFGTLENKAVLLLGAGEMAELAVEHLVRHHVGRVFVANRTFERGVTLAAKYKGQAIRFEEVKEHLSQVDIIISSTGATDFVIRRDDIKAVRRRRRNRSLFFIDIAVPRDIDPDINRLENAYVYDIDDLQGVIDENIEDRQREAVKAQRIVDEAVIRFRRWHDSLDVVPTIVALRDKVSGIAAVEVDKRIKSMDHLSAADHDAIRNMVNAMVNKILHDPTQFLKKGSCQGDKSIPLDITRKLFKLDP
ncbi:MAG: glutamyl-tRNA reductase [Desulfobacteraceae bacterium]|nr:glutamyl-tRNA reductase [Desulfobacteraceae bacterium]